MPQRKGDISSIMNQCNKEDNTSVDSPKFDKNNRNLNEIKMTNRNLTNQAKINAEKRANLGGKKEQKMQEMGGLIMTKEVNNQVNPQFLKKKERQQVKNRPDSNLSNLVQPSPRFSGTKKLNSQYSSFNKLQINNNMRISKPPNMRLNDMRGSTTQRTPSLIDTRQMRTSRKDNPLFRTSKMSGGSLFNRPSRAPSDGSLFMRSEENNHHQAIRNRSTLLRGLAQSRSPQVKPKDNPNEKLFTMSGPFNPLLLCGCTGQNYENRASQAMTMNINRNEVMRSPHNAVVSETYITNDDDFESDYEVVNQETQNVPVVRDHQRSKFLIENQHNDGDDFTDSDNDAKEMIYNEPEEVDSSINQMQTPDNKDHFNHFRLKIRSKKNQDFDFGSFNNCKNNLQVQDQQIMLMSDPSPQRDRSKKMHHVSPKFNRISLDQTNDDANKKVLLPHDESREFTASPPYLESMPKPRKLNYCSPPQVHIVQAAVMGLSIEPITTTKSKKSPEPSQQSQDQSTMVDHPKLKFDTSNRNIKEQEPAPAEYLLPPRQSCETVNISESKELCRSETKELCNNQSSDHEKEQLEHPDELEQPEEVIPVEQQSQLQQQQQLSQQQELQEIETHGGSVRMFNEEKEDPEDWSDNQAIQDQDADQAQEIEDEQWQNEKEDETCSGGDFVEPCDDELAQNQEIAASEDKMEQNDGQDEDDMCVNEKDDIVDDDDDDGEDKMNVDERVNNDDLAEVDGGSQAQAEMNLTQNSCDLESSPEKKIQQSILEKDDDFENDFLNPVESVENRNSIEKSDGTIHQNFGQSKVALQQNDNYLIDSNQIAAQEQQSLAAEQTNSSMDSPVRNEPRNDNDDSPCLSEGEKSDKNPEIKSDENDTVQIKSQTSQEIDILKKSFAYGLEDVEGGQNNQVNLAITKHNESVRDAPLDPQSSIRLNNFDSEGKLPSLPSEIRGSRIKPIDSFDNKGGIDNSLAEVLKVFKDNEKKSKKGGNFGWNKAVQHTTIRLNDAGQDANKVEKNKHMRTSSKMSIHSHGVKLNGALRQSQGSFTQRMHKIQSKQFGLGTLPTKTPGVFHSKKSSISSQYKTTKNVLNKLGSIDNFLPGNKRKPLNNLNGTQNLNSFARQDNLKGVMKTQINLASTGNSQASSLYEHVIHAKKPSKDMRIKLLQSSLKAKGGNPRYKARVEKKKEMPFQLGSGPNDHLVCQGNLFRYKPGIQKDFVHRWVQMTQQEFRYFENSLKAEGCLKQERLQLMAKYSGQKPDEASQNIQCAKAVPLISIPTCAILKAIRLKAKDFEVTNNRNKMEDKDLYKNMFEIKLKCDYDQLHNYRTNDLRTNIDTVSRCSKRQSPMPSNHNRSQSKFSKRTPSVSSYFGTPIPKKKNMFVQKFSKSPNVIRDQNNQNSFNRNLFQHKKSFSRQQNDLKVLNSAVVNKVKTKLNKTTKRSAEGSNQKGKSTEKKSKISSIERDNQQSAPGKISFYRSRSQMDLKVKKSDKKLIAPSQMFNEGFDEREPITQRNSLNRTKSSNIHSNRESMVSRKNQFKLNGRKKSAAALFSKSKFGKIGQQQSSQNAPSDAHMLSFGQSINDVNSQGGGDGKSVGQLHNRSNSNGSGAKIRQVVPGQLMPMPLNKSKSSGKIFFTPNKSNISGFIDKPKQFNVKLQGQSYSQLRECSSQISLRSKLNKSQSRTARSGLSHYRKNADAINPYKDGQTADTKSNGKIIQICASNRSISYNKSRYTDDTHTPAVSERKMTQQWSQRQQLWYQEERRIIFSAQSNEQVKQWISTINKFVQELGACGQQTIEILAEDNASVLNQSKMSKISKVSKVSKVSKISKVSRVTAQTKRKKRVLRPEQMLLKGLKQFNKGNMKQMGSVMSRF